MKMKYAGMKNSAVIVLLFFLWNGSQWALALSELSKKAGISPKFPDELVNFTSADRIHWKEHGPLDIRYSNGKPLTKGPFGTPAARLENNTWYLFYERDDLGIWLATSTDLKVWKNVQDEPVIKMGPELYHKYAICF
jgi:hypothetical protein